MTIEAAIEADLLPCPFCGPKGELTGEWPQLFEHSSECVTEYSVRCGSCGIDLGDESRDEALRLWNTRQPTTPTTGEDYGRAARRVITEMSATIDLADRLIECGHGTDQPRSWRAALRKVTKARAALAAISPTTEDAEKRVLVEAHWHWLLESKEAEAIVPSRKSRLSLINGMVRAENEMKQALASIGERS